MNVSAYSLALRFIGIKEDARPHLHNAQVLTFLRLDDKSVTDDETPWCSAFTNYIAWLLALPRSKSLSARSWLTVGTPVDLRHAEVGYDVVVLARGSGVQPGPEVLAAPGHVGFFAGIEHGQVFVLGGNQGDAVSVVAFPKERVLGVRRLRNDA